MPAPKMMKAPGEDRVSMTKVTAIGVAAWPWIEQMLGADPGAAATAVPMVIEAIRTGGPWALAGLALVFLRRALPGQLGALLDSYQKAFADRERLRRRVASLEAELQAARGAPSDETDLPL